MNVATSIRIYFVLSLLGALLNTLHALALIRCKKNGFFWIIFQIVLVDLLSLYVCYLEITTLDQKDWSYSSENCRWFAGLEILVNTTTLYLLVSMNFHAVSLWNLHRLILKKSRKNPLNLQEEEELLENRAVTIDYSRRKQDIGVVLPLILIWFVGVSLSVPSFILTSTLKLDNRTICMVMDGNYDNILQYFLIAFEICVPIVLMLCSTILVVIKMIRKLPDEPLGKSDDIRRLLVFSFVLTSLYAFTSFQRHVLKAMEVFGNFGYTQFTFRGQYLKGDADVYLVMLHYSGPILRSVMYLVLLPKFRLLVRNKLCCCTIRK